MPGTASAEPPRGLPVRIDGVRVSAPEADGAALPILSVGRLALPPGGRVAVTGPSGAGKSTLLGILSGIVRPGSGRVVWGDEDICRKREGARDRWRRQHVGLVFQDFHLVPELCVLGNVLMPSRFERWRTPRPVRDKAEALLAAVGLRDVRRRAGLLSRGEQQRAAIARALLHDPAAILADEPTASLDPENGRGVADLLLGTAERLGATLIVATHDTALIARLGARWVLRDGTVGEVA